MGPYERCMLLREAPVPVPSFYTPLHSGIKMSCNTQAVSWKAVSIILQAGYGPVFSVLMTQWPKTVLGQYAKYIIKQVHKEMS